MKTIWAKEIREVKNHTLAFHYRCVPGASARLEILACNVYRLFVGGRFTGYGPARAAHGYVRADTYDLSGWAGRQTDIVVEVFAANINGYYILDALPFFGAVLTEEDTVRAVSEDFGAYLLSDRVSKVQRYSFQRTFTESYRMKACRSRLYHGDTSLFERLETEEVPCASVLARNVSYPDLTGAIAARRIASGTFSADPGRPVWTDRAIQSISDKLKGYRYEELDDRLSDEAGRFVFRTDAAAKGTETLDAGTWANYRLDRTVTGFFGLKVRAEAKTTLYILWDEILTESPDGAYEGMDINFNRTGTCNVIKYVLEPGEYDLLAFEPVSAQFVKIAAAEGRVRIAGLTMTPYENRDAYALAFHSEDGDFESILRAAANTFSQNAADILMDCPSRERAGWLCDSYFSGRAERFFTGGNAVERNFLENFALAPQLPQLPEGMVGMCYPSDHYDGVYIPNWAMWYILELRNYLLATGDRQLILDSRDKVYGLVRFFRKYLNGDGLLEDLENWVFIEWSKCNDADHIRGVNYPSNMLYAGMLDAAAEMYGDGELSRQASAIRETIARQAYRGGFFEDNAVRTDGKLALQGHLTETCQYYAFYFGVATKEKYPELFDKMVRVFGPERDDTVTYPDIARSNAIVGNYLRLEILLHHGLFDDVIRECRSFFTAMAARTGTLWEHSFESGSLNHGFASIAANYLAEAVTGFVRTDIVRKKVILHRQHAGMECTMSIPVPGDKPAVFAIRGGTRTLALPEGYEAEYLP